MDTSNKNLVPTPANGAASATQPSSTDYTLSREEAIRLTDYLLSAYPTQQIRDLEGYIANIISILMMFKAIDARTGVQAAMDACQFVPSRYEVHQACDKAKADRVIPGYGQQWDSCSRQQLQERAEQESSETPEQRRALAKQFLNFLKLSPQERERVHPRKSTHLTYTEAVKCHGRPIGAFEPGGYLNRGIRPAGAPERKSHGETPASVMARHGLSQADWEAIPDQPTNPGYWEGQR